MIITDRQTIKPRNLWRHCFFSPITDRCAIRSGCKIIGRPFSVAHRPFPVFDPHPNHRHCRESMCAVRLACVRPRDVPGRRHSPGPHNHHRGRHATAFVIELSADNAGLSILDDSLSAVDGSASTGYSITGTDGARTAAAPTASPQRLPLQFIHPSGPN